ncbi:cupin domain-containing protein [Euzebyella saccharophila]|uniref:Cupin domain-containing protein n=1 Tax=Euzebyella saccharophila TaxID=679664 RepID=A0ABV8JSK2_9FLAO|nr:cupin domain-containing protein [Euzebyella saccharophila]
MKRRKPPYFLKVKKDLPNSSPGMCIRIVWWKTIRSTLLWQATCISNRGRSNWHSHPAGQILVVIDGVGYHQFEGEPRETIKKGDVIKCPPNTKHWRGASTDTGMSHIYILPNTEKGIVEWLEPVTDEQYSN